MDNSRVAVRSERQPGKDEPMKTKTGVRAGGDAQFDGGG